LDFNLEETAMTILAVLGFVTSRHSQIAKSGAQQLKRAGFWQFEFPQPDINIAKRNLF